MAVFVFIIGHLFWLILKMDICQIKLKKKQEIR